MGRFVLYIAGFGFPDHYLCHHCLSTLKVYKKGDIWRSRTGDRYTQNIFKYIIDVQYETGIEPAADKIIEAIKKDGDLLEILTNCEYVELHVSISIGEEFRIPQIHLTAKQMEFFGQLGAELEIHIS